MDAIVENEYAKTPELRYPKVEYPQIKFFYLDHDPVTMKPEIFVKINTDRHVYGEKIDEKKRLSAYNACRTENGAFRPDRVVALAAAEHAHITRGAYAAICQDFLVKEYGMPSMFSLEFFNVLYNTISYDVEMVPRANYFPSQDLLAMVLAGYEP